MRTKPFTVIQNGKPIFTVYAYSIEQARALVAAHLDRRSHRRAGVAAMMPRTVHNMDALVCISAMQKAIRRGLEEEAMQFAVELLHTSPAFHSMVLNRLEIIAHEDIDVIASPWIVPFVAAAVAQSKARYGKHVGEARLVVGNIVRLLCRAPKSRAGCHFAAAIGLRSMLEGYAPELPDYALDMHTMKGKAMGRGLDHFRSEGAKLVPPPTEPDPFEDEAYRLWAIKQRCK